MLDANGKRKSTNPMGRASKNKRLLRNITAMARALFLLRPVYGDIDALVATIKSWGVAEVEFVETRNAPFIPAALKLPFMVGRIGIIKGKK